jgi:nucleotide-binding universal stress UspA family protein
VFDTVIVAVDDAAAGRDALALARALRAGRVEPAQELRAVRRLAAERDAELIVLGAAPHGALARLHLTDAARTVLHHAPCPVAIAPRGYHAGGGELRRVAVGYDGSPAARAALALASAWCEANDAGLTVHVAWEAPIGLVGHFGEDAHHDRLVLELHGEALAVAESAVSDLPHAERRVSRGRAREVLERVARDTDLLVIGSTGRGAVHRLAEGSTSDHVVHHATCPVLVVHGAVR